MCRSVRMLIPNPRFQLFIFKPTGLKAIETAKRQAALYARADLLWLMGVRAQRDMVAARLGVQFSKRLPGIGSVSSLRNGEVLISAPSLIAGLLQNTKHGLVLKQASVVIALAG